MPPAVSKKRKLGDGETKYYAVRAGKVPGVYLDWKNCQENITGFKGASYKSFLTRKDAEDYVAGKNPSGPSDAKAGDKFYAVAVGHRPGVYLTWTECQAQILDVKGPKYKKFPTRAEAEEWVRSTRIPSATASRAGKQVADFEVEESGPVAKKVKVGSSKAAKKTTVVYTDGSSLGNGKLGASAGVGVYFGERDSRNVSERLAGQAQTNQRAELTAIVRALEITSKDPEVEIITDSQYSINCVTVWYKNWALKNWVKSDGGKVVNQDLVVLVRKLIDEREKNGKATKFTWIKGHANDPGNTAADNLAVMGARRGR